MAGPLKKCYRCNEEAETREHVPPRCFLIPAGFTENLLTVPSCEKHNNGNSQEVEKVKAMIASSIHTNELAEGPVLESVNRSFRRRPHLIAKTYGQVVDVLYNGEQTGAFDLDFKALAKVMASIAHGVYFWHFKKHFYGRWHIVSTQAVTLNVQSEEMRRKQLLRNRMFEAFGYQDLPLPNPRVFRCGLYRESDLRVIFRFCFFEGLIIHAVGIPFWVVDPRFRVT